MKVLHILNHFLPHQVAGTEVYCFALVKGLLQRNVTAAAVIPFYGQSQSDAYEYEGVKVLRYAEPSTVDRALQMGFRSPDGLEHFKELLQKEQPQIVHFHELAGSNGITLWHVKAAKALGFKVIMTFHLAGYSCKSKTLLYQQKSLCDGIIKEYKCTRCMLQQQAGKWPANIASIAAMGLFAAGVDLSKKSSRLGTALGYPFIIQRVRKDLLALSEHCDVLVTLTNWYQQMLVKNGVPSSKITINPQGLIQQRMAPTMGIIHSETISFVFVGRISHYKGVHLLLDAFKNIDPALATIDIYGHDAGDEYARVQRKQMETIPSVRWKGSIAPADVVETMQAYQALILPSTFSEMSPLVIQEAFAAGIPVIASHVYGNAEQVQHGKNGWLFECNNASHLEQIIQLLIKDRTLLQTAQQHLPTPRSFDDVVSAYMDTYHQMLN